MANDAHQNSLFIGWLNDAYAMENAIVETLESQIQLAEDHPDIREALQKHLEQTRSHADVVKSCLAQFDEKPSDLKKVVAAIGSKLQGIGTGSAKDDLIKAVLQDYTAEHMEMASYHLLIAGASMIGMPTIGDSLKPVLEDEVAMARWLETQFSPLAHATLSHGES